MLSLVSYFGLCRNISYQVLSFYPVWIIEIYIKLLPTLLLLLSSNFEKIDGLVMGTTLLQMGLLIS